MKKFLKIFIILIIVLLMAFIGYRVYITSLVINIQSKTFETLGKNYYIKLTENNKDFTYIGQGWFLNDDVAIKRNTVINNVENVGTKIYYTNTDKILKFITEETKTATIAPIKDDSMYKRAILKIIGENYLTPTVLYSSENSTFLENYYNTLAIYSAVKYVKTTKVDGTQCYEILLDNDTFFIAKENCLPIKSINNFSNVVTTYDISVGSVTETDVKLPDLTDYVVQLDAINYDL